MSRLASLRPSTRQALIVTAGIVAVLIGSVVALSISHANGDRRILQNACANNLRLIDNAKHQWASQHQATNTAPLTWEDLQPYIRHATELPTCPLGGSYTLGSSDQKPTCSIPGHALP